MLAPLASAATSVLGERFVQRAGGALGGMLGGVRNAPGGLLGRVAGPVAAFFGTLLTPGNAGQGAWNDRDMIRAHADAGGGRVGTEAALQAMEQAVARGVERGLHGANVNATVSAHDAGAHVPLTHTPLVQSAPLRHVFPSAHLGQVVPPQSTADSTPFCTVSVHVAT